MEEDMQGFVKFIAAATLLIGAGTMEANADACSGRSHDTGTALGALGGAAIGGLASHSVGGALIGGVAGGFAGNAIARSNDCHRTAYRSTGHRYSYIGRDGRRHYAYR